MIMKPPVVSDYQNDINLTCWPQLQFIFMISVQGMTPDNRLPTELFEVNLINIPICTIYCAGNLLRSLKIKF